MLYTGAHKTRTIVDCNGNAGSTATKDMGCFQWSVRQSREIYTWRPQKPHAQGREATRYRAKIRALAMLNQSFDGVPNG